MKQLCDKTDNEIKDDLIKSYLEEQKVNLEIFKNLDIIDMIDRLNFIKEWTKPPIYNDDIEG